MSCHARFLSALFAVGAPALAQFVPGTIQNSNVSFAFASFPMSPTAVGGGADFRVAGTTGPDHLYEAWWYYRIDGDQREYAFNNGPAQGPCTSVYAGNVAILAWDNVDNRGISAQLVAAVNSTGPRAGVLVHRMTVTNVLSHPITLNLYGYADVDQCGVTANGATPSPDGNRQRIVPNAGCSTIGEILAPDADRWQVAPYPQLANLMGNPTLNQLANTGLPATGIDYTAAWQWQNRVLGPGESFTAHMVLGEDFSHSGCMGRASSSVYGSGQPGTRGMPGWATESKPLLGTTPSLRVDNGLPGAIPIGLVSLGQTNLPVPGFGTLLVDPAYGISTVALRMFDPSGVSDTPFTIPNDGSLCGLPAYWQAAFLDPIAPGGIALTNGLAWLVGGVGWFCGCAGAWPPAPAAPCAPGMVVQTANPGGVCVSSWFCSFFGCTLTRQWQCNSAGVAWVLIGAWTGGCP